MTSDALDSRTATRFRTGRPSLDFVHTGGVGRWMAAELIHDANDLERWLAFVLGEPGVRAEADDVQTAKAFRNALWELAQARVAGRELSPHNVAQVNAVAAVAPPIPHLSASGTAYTITPIRAEAALSALARDAIDLFTGPLADRIRTCAADDCELLFVDASRPGRRRWCSMGRCGSISKMRSYRARTSR